MSLGRNLSPMFPISFPSSCPCAEPVSAGEDGERPSLPLSGQELCTQLLFPFSVLEHSSPAPPLHGGEGCSQGADTSDKQCPV